jgi:hypothetical protein
MQARLIPLLTAFSILLATLQARAQCTDWRVGPLDIGGGYVNYVSAMTNYAGRLVAGGNFQQSTNLGPPAHNIVGWDGVVLTAYGTGMDGDVVALKSFKYPGLFGDSELIAGGLFTHAGGVAANRIARWDQDPFVAFPPPAWQAMGNGFTGDVFAIERYNSATYAGGAFVTSGFTPLSRIARWNETTKLWEAVGTGMNGTVRALKAYNGYLYAGGEFTTAGGVSTGALARWDGSTWSQVNSIFNTPGAVSVLEVHNGRLVIAGDFSFVSPYILQYDGSSFSFGIAGTDAPVSSLRSTGARLYVGGNFTTVCSVTANHVAYWDGTWHEVSGGPDGPVSALGAFNGELHAGGQFGTVRGGALASPGWAKYSETGVPWIAYHPLSQSVLSGANVSFSAQPAAGYSGLSFQWYRNQLSLSDGTTGTGSTISGANTQLLSLTNVSQADAGLYGMELRNACGRDSSFAATLTVDGSTGVPANGSPGATVFEAMGPNPSGGPTQLEFSLAGDAQPRFRVYDLAGRLVRVIDMGRLPAGPHQGTWDARDNNGHRVHAGLYFVSLEVDGQRLGDKRLTVLH